MTTWADVTKDYASPKEWLEESDVSKQQRELRQNVFDMARWRATQLAAKQYPLRIFSYFHENWKHAPADKKAELVEEWKLLRRPSGLDVEIDDANTLRLARAGDAVSWDNTYSIIQSITFRILQSLDIKKGKKDYKIEDVYCAKEDTLACPTDLPTRLPLVTHTTAGWITESKQEARAKDAQDYIPTHVETPNGVKTILEIGSAAAIAYDVTRPHPEMGYPSLETAINRIVLYHNQVEPYLSSERNAVYPVAQRLVHHLYPEGKDHDIDLRARQQLETQIEPSMLTAMNQQQNMHEIESPYSQNYPIRTTGIPPRQEDEIPTRIGTPGYEDLRTRMVQLLDEVVWLTAYGGYRQIIPAGVEKAMGPPNKPDYRSFSWVFKQFVKNRYNLDRDGLQPVFYKRDSRYRLISIGEDLLEYAQLYDMPRLNELRIITFPGAELYRRTIWEPQRAAEQSQLALEAAAFYHGADSVREMRPTTARKIAHKVRDAIEQNLQITLRTINQERIAQGLPRVKENIIRYIPAGWLRWRMADNIPVSWANYLVYNTQPSIFTSPDKPLPNMMTRIAALTAANQHGWQATPGRQSLDIVADGLRVTFSEVPDFPNMGGYMLFYTGPGEYTLKMQQIAQEKGFTLNAFGLYQPMPDKPDKPQLVMVRSTIPDPNFSWLNWSEIGERAIFEALGLRYHTASQRWAGAMPEDA